MTWRLDHGSSIRAISSAAAWPRPAAASAVMARTSFHVRSQRSSAGGGQRGIEGDGRRGSTDLDLDPREDRAGEVGCLLVGGESGDQWVQFHQAALVVPANQCLHDELQFRVGRTVGWGHGGEPIAQPVRFVQASLEGGEHDLGPTHHPGLVRPMTGRDPRFRLANCLGGGMVVAQLETVDRAVHEELDAERLTESIAHLEDLVDEVTANCGMDESAQEVPRIGRQEEDAGVT